MNYALLEGLVSWRRSIPALEDVFFWHAMSASDSTAPEGRPAALLSIDGLGGESMAADTTIEFVLTEILSFDQVGDEALPDLTKYERLLKRNMDGKSSFGRDVAIVGHNFVRPTLAPQYGTNAVTLTWRCTANVRPREVTA
ncbi:MAG: hypothetical protein EPN91_00460 [Salinibacterium sp.]|nr:MAG: hypothetical protein EPN91_00460 [Salinibacterium sp.]